MDGEGNPVELVIAQDYPPLNRICESGISCYGYRVSVYQSSSELRPGTEYFIKARWKDGEEIYHFTTGEGIDTTPPESDGIKNVTIDYHAPGEAISYFGGGMCAPEEILASEVSEEDLERYRELDDRELDELMEGHYHVSVEVSTVTDEAPNSTASLFREKEEGLEHILTTAVANSNAVLTFIMDEDEVSNHEGFQIQIEDIFGNRFERKISLAINFDGDDSVFTATVDEDDPGGDPSLPPPPPEPAESEVLGGCSLIRERGRR
ncbi:MAG: hypothetical protein HY542_07120 [Deltaproteobacteria bacterium]|nr:hypothetical protein [Deltaproteobacteria bacterium]